MMKNNSQEEIQIFLFSLFLPLAFIYFWHKRPLLAPSKI